MQSEALDVALDELRDAKEQLGALKRDRGRSNRDAVAQEKIWKQLVGPGLHSFISDISILTYQSLCLSGCPQLVRWKIVTSIPFYMTK